ncbi:folate-sensitive fragile site protein Fra10Ac1-domain-containing protein [Phlyctochytrium arcticum]|nr:folate-sensitive fragile site protein Fra10Ac1-domain-containing protein [Phlyctochytrium arcticum]
MPRTFGEDEHQDRNTKDCPRFFAKMRQNFPHTRKLMGEYLSYYGKAAEDRRKVEQERGVRTEIQILKERHRFLRDDEDDVGADWESRLAKKYYDRLFKEYCLANLSKFKTGQIALRWRTQREVISGKGQFICGNLACDVSEKESRNARNRSARRASDNDHVEASDPTLRSWEVNFRYEEVGTIHNALIKLRLCNDCAYMLNYRKIKESRRRLKEERKRKSSEKKARKRQKRVKTIQESEDRSSNVTAEVANESTAQTSEASSDSNSVESADEDDNSHPGHKEQYTKDEVSRIWRAPQEVDDTDEKKAFK